MDNAWSRVDKMKNYEPIRFEYDFDKDPWKPDAETAEWILDIVGCIDRLYYALSIEEFTEIYNSREGFHMDVAEARKAIALMYILTIAGATGSFEEDEKDRWNGEDDIDDDLYYLPLKDKKTGKNISLACLLPMKRICWMITSSLKTPSPSTSPPRRMQRIYARQDSQFIMRML